MFDDDQRGTGRTTRQMQGAAKGALFLSCHEGERMNYDVRLARALGREDLVIKPFRLLDQYQAMLGRTYPEVVVDHACYEVEEANGDRGLARYAKRKHILDAILPSLVRKERESV
jgi:hypothetical protein